MGRFLFTDTSLTDLDLFIFSISSCVSFSKLYFSKKHLSTHLSCLTYWHEFIHIISFYSYLISVVCNNASFSFLILVIHCFLSSLLGNSCYDFFSFIHFWSVSVVYLLSDSLINVLMYIVAFFPLPLFYTSFSSSLK